MVVCSALMVKAGRLHVALSYPSTPCPRQTLPSSVWKSLQSCRRRQRPPLMLALLALTLPGLHMLRMPGDLPAEDGAAGAHGVSHRGNALQGQARLVPGHGLGGGGIWHLSLEACLCCPSSDSISVDRASVDSLTCSACLWAWYRWPLLESAFSRSARGRPLFTMQGTDGGLCCS